MRRKVIKHGPSTYIISLPSKWVRRNGVEKGDELEVTIEGNSLLVTRNGTVKENAMEADVSGLAPRLIDRFLARSYQKGFDRIRFIYKEDSELKALQAKILELIGFEMVEQDSSSCTIRSISNKLDLDFDKSLQKAFQTVHFMIVQCKEGYSTGDKEVLKNIYLKDLEVNRLCYYCLRQLSKEHHTIPEVIYQKQVTYYIIETLEDLGDCVKKMGPLLARVGKKKEFLTLIDDLEKFLEVSRSYFYQATKDKANKAYEDYLHIRKKIHDAAHKGLKGDEAMCLMLISDSANIIYHFTTMRLDFLKST